MSLRHEQYRALALSRQLLLDLLDPQRRPRTAKELRSRASACLHHFPFLHDNGQPMWSQDDLTLDYNARKTNPNTQGDQNERQRPI